MPTGGASGEFRALNNATYWVWDDEDMGFYVYEPQEGDAGKIGSGHYYEKNDALLFFPAAGLGDDDGGLDDAGREGCYWSSTLDSGETDGAYYLNFSSGIVYLKDSRSRYRGCSVRPLSD